METFPHFYNWPPPHPPSIGHLLILPLSAASSTSLYRPPPQPPSIGHLRNLPLSSASTTSLYRPPPQPPSIGRLLNLPDPSFLPSGRGKDPLMH
ncbi:hypothetical protein JTE90_018399 [Oedothorax gibbosus]|uniref:Uncharacterized protein n=1 Tax=Oedothorax gibbosus TaxID=931172 RepID=A0AAV6THX1_9ARAC|nr:hypothetical protein JTE90_018399 [Oedothorax gibbosus]